MIYFYIKNPFLINFLCFSSFLDWAHYNREVQGLWCKTSQDSDYSELDGRLIFIFPEGSLTKFLAKRVSLAPDRSIFYRPPGLDASSAELVWYDSRRIKTVRLGLDLPVTEPVRNQSGWISDPWFRLNYSRSKTMHTI